MAMSATDICSPLARSMSISRECGSSVISKARPSSSSVVCPRAETTTTTSYPFFLASATLRTAAMILSRSATEVPPNFCTMMLMFSVPT